MIPLLEDAEKVYFLGVEVYAFGLYAALGAALGIIALALLLRRHQWKVGTAPLAGALVILCAFFLSRLFFCGMDSNLGAAIPLRVMVRFNTGGYSMMGALLGASLGAALAARLTRQSVARLLDFLAPTLLLFIACERLGEGYIENFGVKSLPAAWEALQDGFLIVRPSWVSDYSTAVYLATYKIESFTALVLAIFLLIDVKQSRRAGGTFLLFLMLFGATQIILENLRDDLHMKLGGNWSFAYWQQIIAFLLLAAGVITLAVQRMGSHRKLSVAALIALAASLGLAIFIEFALEGSRISLPISHSLLYVIYVIILAAPVTLGIMLRRVNHPSDKAGD